LARFSEKGLGPTRGKEAVMPDSTLAGRINFLKTAIQERRAWKRYTCRFEGQCKPVGNLHISSPWPATLQDISQGGFQLMLSRRFEPGTLLVVEANLPREESARMFLGRVVRVSVPTQGRWVLGCALSTPLAKDDLATLIKISQAA
jgi:hypothetical protein